MRGLGHSIFGTESFEDLLVFAAVDEALGRLGHTAIGGGHGRNSGSGARSLSLNSADETVKGVFAIQVGEFNPGSLREKGGNLGRLPESGEKDRDDREILITGSPVQCHQHFLAMPGAESLRAYEDQAGTAVSEPVLQFRLPESPRDEMPLVQERIDPRVEEPLGKPLHRRLVGAAVAEEDVVAVRHGD
jgi:hypothetical protein